MHPTPHHTPSSRSQTPWKTTAQCMRLLRCNETLAHTPNELTPVNPQVEYMYRDSAKSPEPTYDDKWNTMERSNAWFVNPIHEQYECGANELASALQDTAIANACQQELYEEVDNY
jgi:hypothetical protein